MEMLVEYDAEPEVKVAWFNRPMCKRLGLKRLRWRCLEMLRYFRPWTVRWTDWRGVEHEFKVYRWPTVQEFRGRAALHESHSIQLSAENRQLTEQVLRLASALAGAEARLTHNHI